MTTKQNFFFAGGGTGGHIYPAIAVAQQIIKLDQNARIHFFCSQRDIDKKILSNYNFDFTPLPAVGFSLSPAKLIDFYRSFIKSCALAKQKLTGADNATVIGVGGFVAAPACWCAHRNNIPVKIINTDFVPGRANKLLSHFADEIFLQFDRSAEYFKRSTAKKTVTGCPLRIEFENPNPQKAIDKLQLYNNKNTLLITGASSGAQNINEAVTSILEKLDEFEDSWQIVHLTGSANLDKVKRAYANAKISHAVIGYYDDMADLLACADLVIGRSGAVSVAEYVTTVTPSICMPYPYHKDRHQYKNADHLVQAGAAIIVDDLPDKKERADWLIEELLPLLKDDEKRGLMADACRKITPVSPAKSIAKALLKLDAN